MCIILRKKSPSFWDPKPAFWAHAAKTSHTYQEQTEAPGASHKGKQNPNYIPELLSFSLHQGGNGVDSSPGEFRCQRSVLSQTPPRSLSLSLCQTGTSPPHKWELKSRTPALIQLKEQTLVFSGAGGCCLCVGGNSEHQLSLENTHYSSWLRKRREKKKNLLFTFGSNEISPMISPKA